MRLDEIENHGEDAFYQAVGIELAAQLGCEIRLQDIKLRDGRSSSKIRTVRFQGKTDEGEFVIVLSQSWGFDQSASKPTTRVSVTDLEGLGNQGINLGRVGIFRDDPADLAKVLNHQGVLSHLIDELFE